MILIALLVPIALLLGMIGYRLEQRLDEIIELLKRKDGK